MVPNLWFFRHIPSRRELTLSWPGRSKTPGPIRPFAPTGCARTPALPPDLAARTVAGGARGGAGSSAGRQVREAKRRGLQRLVGPPAIRDQASTKRNLVGSSTKLVQA